jgi:5-methylcytosine-specific restriction protein B
VLRESPEPLSGTEVFRRAAERVELTSYELEPITDSGQPRWENHLRWHTGDVATVGWMSKRDGKWSLTDAGETALDTYGEGQFVSELRRLYNGIRKRRARAVEELGPVQQVIAQALSIVDPGAWTAYDDLAELVEAKPDSVQHLLASGRKPIEGAYRALYRDGRLPAEGDLHALHRGMNLRTRLADEGVEFDEDGHAVQAQRMTAADIEARLADLGDLVSDQPRARRAWLVRGSSVDGVDLIPRWLDEKFVSLAASNLPSMVLPISFDELKPLVQEGYQHKTYAIRDAKLREYNAFINRIRPGDYLLTTSKGATYLGQIVGDASSVKSDDNRSNLRREVRWLNPGKPVNFAALPDPLPAKLSSQSDVVDLTENLAAIEDLLRRLDIAIEEPSTEPVKPLAFPEITKEFAKKLFVGHEWLEEQVEILRERRQMIFYGPPGTGKTYLAMQLADYLTQNAEANAVTLVQFHPSFTYEDFFEGFRPVRKKEGGQIEFDVHYGPFRVLVEAARDHSSDPYVLIIDEINRANIAKVFGELYFLLEYRSKRIDLLYSGQSDFTLPENVFIIGTMNTTDRSLTQLDAAMRRRFAFTELHPSEPPTKGLLPAWLGERQKEQPEEFVYNLGTPKLLDELNNRITEYDLAIGPSFFMQPNIYRQERGLARVWKNSILPLLAEHHLGGSRTALTEFQLTKIRRAVDGKES